MSFGDKIACITQEIEEAKRTSHRKGDEIRIVAVSKYATVEQIQEAYTYGQRDFGESKVQEALVKMQVLPSDIRWHLLGPLQSNKIAKILGKFFLIHAIDTLAIARLLSQKSKIANVVSNVLIQLNISKEKTKHGFLVEDFLQCHQELFSLEGLHIQGLMTMAPHSEDLSLIRECFATLKRIRDQIRHETQNQKLLPVLSMGMSHDFSIAVEEGATLVRIGSALFS